MTAARGDCFKTAADFVASHSDATLVHATVRGQGPLEGMRYEHAWIEVGDLAIDLSNGNLITLPAVLYRKAADLTHERRYDQQQTCRLLITEGHYGPWDPDPEADG